MPKIARTRTYCLIVILLSAATLISYWGVRSCGFAYDDAGYIKANPYIKHGLSPASVIWALTSPYQSNWHPLTWISHILDYQMWGLNPSGHHLTSLLFHLANTLLLFFVLSRMTGAVWRSAFVSALFGVHPLHVESVAWISERKDVLSTFFLLLTLWAYHSYTLRPKSGRYLLVMLLFALGLMAKPMLVTVPLLLLILDYWPLKRLQWKAVTEKIPLFVLALGSCIVTFIAQQSGGSVGTLRIFPLLYRIENALVAYVTYVVKMVWPSKLAAFYPFPSHGLPIWQVIGSALFLACITVLAIAVRRKYPQLLAGWLWYVIALVPVIGLIQVGSQSMADRYTYVPLVGLFIAITWSVSARYRTPAAVASCGILVALVMATRAQVPYWHDNLTLFRHALAVTPDNATSRGNLGTAMLEQGDVGGAIANLSKSLAMEPWNADTRVNLGDAYARKREWSTAIAEYRRVLASAPNQQSALCNLGRVMENTGDSTGAMACYLKAIEADANCATAHSNLGGILEDLGSMNGAIEHYSKAIAINPDDPDAHYNLGTALMRLHNTKDSVRELREAIRLRPGFASAHKNLAIALFLAGDYDGARIEVKECERRGIKLHPDFLKALNRASSR